MKLSVYLFPNSVILPLILAFPVLAQPSTETEPNLDVPNQVIQDSPVLQDWLEDVPDVLQEIEQDPAFNTRLRLGYSAFPSSDDVGGLNLGIADIFLGRTGLTLSADYYSSFGEDDSDDSRRNAIGADLQYFILPLGSYFNLAPLVGYRYLESNDFTTDGLRLGLRLMLPLSRTGGGDISVSQSFLSPGGDREVGITSLSVGYGLTSHLRLSGDIELQNSTEDRDNRFGINLEWLLY